MNYISHTELEKKEMLKTIGVAGINDLFKDIPENLRPKSFNIPDGKSEFEVMKHLKSLSRKNATHLTDFVGAGFYDHYIPAAVDALGGTPEVLYCLYTLSSRMLTRLAAGYLRIPDGNMRTDRA